MQKYRTNQYVPDQKGQEFDPFVKQYKLNEVTGVLEEAGVVNVQEQIQSYEDCSLDKMLERFGFDLNAVCLDKPQFFSEDFADVENENENEDIPFPDSTVVERAKSDLVYSSLFEKYKNKIPSESLVSRSSVLGSIIELASKELEDIENKNLGGEQVETKSSEQV